MFRTLTSTFTLTGSEADETQVGRSWTDELSDRLRQIESPKQPPSADVAGDPGMSSSKESTQPPMCHSRHPNQSQSTEHSNVGPRISYSIINEKTRIRYICTHVSSPPSRRPHYAFHLVVYLSVPCLQAAVNSRTSPTSPERLPISHIGLNCDEV